MAPRTAENAAGALPDDVLRDILTRVPDPVDLLWCAATCRQWLRVIVADDQSFLRHAGLLPKNGRHASILVGAFCQGVSLSPATKTTGNRSEWPPLFVRLRDHAPPAGADSARLTFTSFIRNDDGLFNYARPLASRRGLLLMRIMPTPLDWRKLHLVVCHPLIGERSTRLLPPPPLNLHPSRLGADVTGYALVTTEDHRTAAAGKQWAFQVLLTTVHSSDRLVYAYSYSSATGIWSTPIKCAKEVGLVMCGPRAGVVARGGIVHWAYTDGTNFYTLDVSADAMHVSLTKIPIPLKLHLAEPPFPCITGGGNLSFVDTAGDGDMLDLWTKREQENDPSSSCEGEGGWLRSKLMSKEDRRIKVVSFLEGRGAIVVTRHEGDWLFTLDLESKNMDLVKNVVYNGGVMHQVCSSRGNWTCNNHVLYEIDWSSYVFHLSTWCQ